MPAIIRLWNQQAYTPVETTEGSRWWIDHGRGLLGVEREGRGVTWLRSLDGRCFELVEHWRGLNEAMVRCLPPEPRSPEVAELVAAIANGTNAEHPEYDPLFHADVVDDNPNFWRPIGRA